MQEAIMAARDLSMALAAFGRQCSLKPVLVRRAVEFLRPFGREPDPWVVEDSDSSHPIHSILSLSVTFVVQTLRRDSREFVRFVVALS
jgi:hypothetical protein